MTIPLVPLYTDDIPSRGNPLTFRVDGDNFNQYFGVIGVDINATATEMNNTAAAIELNEASAAASADIATSAANFIGEWDTNPDGTPRVGALNVPSSVAHNGSTWQLLSDIANVTAHEPGVSGVWQIINNANATVIPQTVSGTLSAGGQINQLRDSGAFTIPLANSVTADAILVVELPRKYTNETPSATVSGSDNLEDENGDDPDGIINWAGAAKLTLTSDGVDTWSL